VHRPADRISAALLRHTVRGMDRLLTVSEDLRRRLVEWRVPADRVRTVPNGCDLSIFRPVSRDEARRALGIGAEEEMILYVGRLAVAKGLGELVEAFASLASTRPNLRLVCVGEGEWRPEWTARLRAGAPEVALRLPGVCTPEGVAQWLAAADVFCLPSHAEGCPNVVIEALACQRPVVATAVGGTPDLVDPAHGLLVPPRQPQALAAALREALERDWSAFGAAPFRRGWDEVARETLELCREAREHFSQGVAYA
jgi:glycosyltransferase involved in cell wall biosynthesis